MQLLAEVWETDESVEVAIDMPEVERDELDVTLEDRRILVRVNTQLVYHYKLIEGVIDRDAADGASATLQDTGVLVVTVKKQGRRV